jgi:DNA topoisomerase-1
VAQPLVIVESPAKATKLAEYLGDDYMVESSIGHVRDLPRNAADVPATHKGEKWARLGIDVDNDFKPLYIVTAEKKDQVRKLKALMKDASELVLATDKDREGEAIAWHLLEVLNPRVPVKRIVFTEITPEAIQRAIDSPGDLNRQLVDAQEARRLLDRLYGYEVSPVLWKKVMQGLSAGRVQSVATRIVVERERERMAFRSANYWDLKGTFDADSADKPFTAMLLEVDGKRVASGRDFSQQGVLTRAESVHLDEATAAALSTALEGRPAKVLSREAKPYRRRPAAPFITSSYQQEASRKLRLSSAQSMRVAQGLYERGFITYMRTDSTTLSDTAVTAARIQIAERYGNDFVPDEPRTYKSRDKSAQEAHEAIRPAGDRFRTPEEVAGELSTQDRQVYELIWQRTVASQMTDATGETVTLRLGVTATDNRETVFSTSGTVIKHQGFLSVYSESKDEDADEDDDAKVQLLPPLEEGDSAQLNGIEAAGHDTQPPSRYNEASLVAKLEELRVGRPSTYASIMGTIQAREYVWKKGTALVPSFKAFAVVTLLEEHFPDLVDYAFTARMEDDLDSIADGVAEAIPYLRDFYFGEGDEPGLHDKVNDRLGDIDARAVNSIPVGADEDGVAIVARVGRYGPYLEHGEDRASIPEDLPPADLTIEKALELLSAPKDNRVLGPHPDTGIDVEVKAGRFGPYVQMGEHNDETGEKPRTASLFKTMDPADVTLEQAVKLLTLPRLIGVDPADGGEITAYNGRYGPYIQKAAPQEDGTIKNDSRSLEAEDELLTIELTKALEVMAQPKRRRGQGAPKPPLRVMGIDPASEKEMVLKEGRFGPYVTDGETNASLRKGDEVESLTIERASELLADRRAKGPAKKKKATKKKAAKKKPTKKKATKKTAAKKAPAKKAAAKRLSAANAVEPTGSVQSAIDSVSSADDDAF